MNIDQLKQDACRTLALIGLIEKSQTKARNIYASPHYTIFGFANERSEAVAKQNQVTQRLVKYLERTLNGNLSVIVQR